MNMWLYQYNYRDFWKKGCTSIELADDLGSIGRPAVTVAPQVMFLNHAKKATVHIFAAGWNSRGYAGEERNYDQWAKYVGPLAPSENLTVSSAEGNVLLVRAKKQQGKLLMEVPVSGQKMQRIHLGKRSKEAKEPSSHGDEL